MDTDSPHTRFFSFSLPLKKPFITASGSFNHRKGLLIHVRNDALSCWAEASPLPGLSQESLSDVITAAPQIVQCISENRNIIKGLPSLKFAADCILWKLYAGYLSNVFLPVSRKIPINMAYGIYGSTVSEVLRDVIRDYRLGYRTFKFKVGVDPDSDESLISAVRQTFPDVNIRIDANCSWTFETAKMILNQWKKYHIEYCEEPVQRSDPEQLKELRISTGIPVAADESVRNTGDAGKLIRYRSVDYLILKPALIGAIENFINICELAASNNIKTVVTTSLESGVGRLWTCAMASVLKSRTAMGLATGFLFSHDVIDDSHLYIGGEVHFTKQTLSEIHPRMDYLKEIIF
jgi:o-succinylbenzoate synthase